MQGEIGKQPYQANDAQIPPDQRRDVLSETLETVAANHPEVVRKRPGQATIDSPAAAYRGIHERASCRRFA
jgi:hypothetical protein